MRIHAFWWGVCLEPENDKDKVALELIKNGDYVRGYDSTSEDNPITYVTKDVKDIGYHSVPVGSLSINR